jgi:NhaP-type Na+/H+ or K+/H+ antiporter
MSLVALLFLGIGLTFYVAGVGLNLDFSKANWREWDVLALLGATFSLFFMALASWIGHGSVMHGLTLIPLMDALNAIAEAVRTRRSRHT